MKQSRFAMRIDAAHKDRWAKAAEAAGVELSVYVQIAVDTFIACGGVRTNAPGCTYRESSLNTSVIASNVTTDVSEQAALRNSVPKKQASTSKKHGWCGLKGYKG